MPALYLLIPVAVVLVALAIRVFFWAVDSGQYDDLDSPAHSILFDDEDPKHLGGIDEASDQGVDRQQAASPERKPPHG
jgi:cbb3-type cytochrome oxidase maturation protein